MDQLQDTVKARHWLAAVGVALEREGATFTLDPQIFGARLSLDTQSEEVALVRAVPNQEGASGFSAQEQVGLTTRHRTPVETAFLQLAHSIHHQLVFAFGAKGLEAQASVQRVAHPGTGELAVGDHGAGSQLSEQSGLLECSGC